MKKISKHLELSDKPPMFYSLHVAISMSIILSNDTNLNWFYSNFCQLCFRNSYRTLLDNHDSRHLLNIYPAELTRPGQIAANLCLKETYVDRYLHLEITNDNFIDFLINCINNNYYVSTLVDVSKLPNTRYENSAPYVHGVIIFGYNLKDNTFSILDFNKYGQLGRIDVSFQDYKSAFLADCVAVRFGGINNSINLYKKNIFKGKIKIEKIIEGMEDYLYSFNTSKKYELIMPELDGQLWGISIYDGLLEYLEYVSSKKINVDYRMFHALYEHKCIMYERFCYTRNINVFFTKECELDKLSELVEKTDIIRLLVLKYNTSKKLGILSQIKIYLLYIKEKEISLYASIIDQLKRL